MKLDGSEKLVRKNQNWPRFCLFWWVIKKGTWWIVANWTVASWTVAVDKCISIKVKRAKNKKRRKFLHTRINKPFLVHYSFCFKYIKGNFLEDWSKYLILLPKYYDISCEGGFTYVSTTQRDWTWHCNFLRDLLTMNLILNVNISRQIQEPSLFAQRGSFKSSKTWEMFVTLEENEA